MERPALGIPSRKSIAGRAGNPARPGGGQTCPPPDMPSRGQTWLRNKPQPCRLVEQRCLALTAPGAGGERRAPVVPFRGDDDRDKTSASIRDT